MSAPLVVAVDGPGGSGKSTVARGVARRLGWRYLDTGAMYRAVTWLALEHRLDIEDPAALSELAERAVLTIATDPDAPSVSVDGTDVSAPIRSRPVTSAVSVVSAVDDIRHRLVEQQRAIIAAAPTGIVVEGRDIGTVVVPDAPLKVFLTASTAERARRRSAEIGEAGDDAVAQTMAELGRRDALDSGRSASPLVQAADAVVVDSTELDVAGVVDLIVNQALARGGGECVRHRVGEGPVVTTKTETPAPPPFRPRVMLVSRAIVRPFLHGPVMRVRAVGRELVPATGPLIVAGNHSSWADGPLIVAECPRIVRCLTKIETYKGPLGSYLHTIGQIPIDRSRPDRTALQTSLKVLEDGEVLGMFPEGTRGSGDLSAVHDGVAWLAVRSRAPILPVAVLGTAQALPKGAKFPNHKPVTVVYGKPFDVTLPENPRSRTALKLVSEEIRQRLVDHLAEARATHG